jgi:hypothetical protein
MAYERRFGLARAAVFVDDLAHIYDEGLEYDPAFNRFGVVSVARLKSRSGGMLFLGLADGAEAILDAPAEVVSKLVEGASLRVEIAAEARQDKLARARLLGAAEGPPRRLSPVASLQERVLARTPYAESVLAIDDPQALAEALDEAEAEALSPSGPMRGGGYLSIERTRALIACDVDSASGQGVASSAAFARACNARAMAEVARRLRLSGLAGLVVVDLIGRRHDGAHLTGLLRDAFGIEPVQVGLLGKFGTLEFVRPWSITPLMDREADPLRLAHLALREAARRAEPGRLLTLRAPAAILDRVRTWLAASNDPLAAVMRLETAAQTEVLLT